MAARQGEKQAEVWHEVQMAWHLNTLPQVYVQSEGYKLGRMMVLFALSGRAERKYDFPWRIKQ